MMYHDLSIKHGEFPYLCNFSEGIPQISMAEGHGWRSLGIYRAAFGAGSQCRSMRSEDVECRGVQGDDLDERWLFRQVIPSLVFF